MEIHQILIGIVVSLLCMIIGSYVGKDVDDKYKLYPIPQDEFTTNPYLTQNPDYQK